MYGHSFEEINPKCYERREACDHRLKAGAPLMAWAVLRVQNSRDELVDE
jgi:hypothetical protein